MAAGISLEAEGWTAVTRAGVSTENRAEVGGRVDKVLIGLALLLLLTMIVDASRKDIPEPWGRKNEEDP
jgi:hypothetical protein